MSRRRRHGTTSATTMLWVALCLVSFGVLSVWTVESRSPAIQADIERRARDAIRSAPGSDLRIEADGRDVALRGRVGSEADRDAVVSRLLVVEGIRLIEDGLKVIPGLRARRTPSPTADDAPPDAWGTNRSASDPVGFEESAAADPMRPATTRQRAGDTAGAPAAPPPPPVDAAPPADPHADIAAPADEADLPERSVLTFAAGSTALGADGHSAVGRMAQHATGGGIVHVYGHADDAGTEWGNHDLSLDRAGRVARALRGAGLPAGRIRIHGAGDQYPLGPAGSSRNRRVELALHGDDQ